MRESFRSQQNTAATEYRNVREVKSRKVRGSLGRTRGSPMSALAIAKEYREIVPRILKEERRTAKIIALRVDATPKSVENWRDGINGPSVPYFIALAREIPELKRKVLEWLDAATGESEDSPERVLADIAKLLEQRGRPPS